MSIPHWLKNRKIQAAMIMVLTFIILLATESRIGLTWDEDIYFRASEIYTSWLGTLFTQPASALSREGIDQSWSFNNEHPPLGKIWSGIVWQGARFVFNDLTAQRLGNMILVSVMLGLLYLLIAGSYGISAGLAAVAALLTMPRFFMHSHLASLDTTAACAVVTGIFLFWKTKDNPGWKWTVIPGLAFGLILATKKSAIFLLPTLFLWALIFHRQLKLLVRIVVMTLIAFPFSFIIWPWIYPDIPGRIWAYIGWNAPSNVAQWYLGKLSMPPPWHFTFVLTWAIIPLTVTLLYLAGMVRAGCKRREADSLGGLLITGALLPLLALAIGQSKLYDQERIFLLIFPFLAGLAGIGFDWLVTGIRRVADRLKKSSWTVPVTILAIVLVFLPQSISMIRLYPHLLSYYSATVGGLPGAASLGMETTYWCESYADAIPYLNEHARPGDMIWVDPFSQNVMVYYQIHGKLREDIKIAYSPNGPNWPFVYDEYGPPTPATHRSSDFIVLQYRQTLMGSTRDNPDRDIYSPHPDFQWVSEREPVYQLSHDGVPIMEIYTNSPDQSGPGQAVVQIPADWKTFKSGTGFFTVQVPPDLEFTGTTEKVYSGDPGIGTYTLHFFEDDSDGDRYSIFYFDLPPQLTADPQAVYGLMIGIRDNWLGSIKGTLIEDFVLSFGNQPVGEAIVETNYNDPPVKGKVRYYLVQNRYYQISIVTPKDRTLPAATDAFLQSFTPLVKVPGDWKTFESREGNFTVQVPPHVEFTRETLELDLRLHTYSDIRDKNIGYGIVYYDQPAVLAAGPDVTQAFMDGHRDGWLNYINGTLIEERNIFLGNYPGREVIVEAKYNEIPGKIKARFYLVHKRFYQIDIRTPKDGTFTPEMDAFLQSFTLLEDE